MAIPWEVQGEIYAAFALLGFILVCIPLYWHMEAWNVGCVLYIFFVGTECLIKFINTVVWRNNAINWAPVYCDITTRFRLAVSIGVCTASLIINRRLYKIATVSSVSISRSDKRRAVLVDCAIGLGIPALAVILYWFYQGHRFDILEGIGCIPAIPNTILSYFLYEAWPIPIGLVSAFYCISTIRAFLKRRKQFNELMASNSNLTFNRYLRLMALASADMLFTVPLGIYSIVSNLKANPIYVWRGLADIHFGFSRVEQMPSFVWRQSPAMVQAMNFDNWMIVACAFLFFALFGLAEEARTHYRHALNSVAKRVGITTFERGSGLGSSGGSGSSGSRALGRITIPTFVQRSKRHDSMLSFSDELSTSISVGDIPDFEELKAPYSPSELSAGSSTCVSSPVDAPTSPRWSRCPHSLDRRRHTTHHPCHGMSPTSLVCRASFDRYGLTCPCLGPLCDKTDSLRFFMIYHLRYLYP
ncbi:Pheromone B alpha 3 receptor [Grifola frondosa]|uniref:Pheromone B alpha 3 receptor n=1 Tax=Grifola frondosa TaxID=5627 RepID=A0A1C7ME01_GRIFR|nr:Pheromone B alpha 3 receptor [Grifola frondosa]